MLRIRRSLQAPCNTQANLRTSQMLEVSGSATGTVSDLAPGQSGTGDAKLLEQRWQSSWPPRRDRAGPARTGPEQEPVRGKRCVLGGTG